ncbi:hypothetical protein EFK4_13980 [Enterococcus faecalis]|nr:hypothetical protein EFK4_13980 [Enterococcus faecalis]
MYQYFTISVFRVQYFLCKKMPPHWGETARGSNKMKNKKVDEYILSLSFLNFNKKRELSIKHRELHYN